MNCALPLLLFLFDDQKSKKFTSVLVCGMKDLRFVGNFLLELFNLVFLEMRVQLEIQIFQVEFRLQVFFLLS